MSCSRTQYSDAGDARTRNRLNWSGVKHSNIEPLRSHTELCCLLFFFGTRDLFNISYSRELYLYSKFLHFEEIVRVKIAVCFEMIVSET